MLSAGVDLRFPFTTGERPLPIRLFNLYLDGIGLAAREDPAVRRSLVEVAQLIRPLSDFFHAGIAARVGLAAFRTGLRQVKATLRRQEVAPVPPMPPTATRVDAPPIAAA